MKIMSLLRLTVWIALLTLSLTLAACGSVADVIGNREAPTPTSAGFSTATPGGKLSVWLLTPTGQAGEPVATNTNGTPNSPGSLVGPAATATAAIATIQAATATAAAPAPAPYYQPNECPEPASPLPPEKPASFTDYNVVIGRYLSVGGQPSVLEATLRQWGAITDTGGVVQADTDLTGDGVREVIVTIYNPAVFNAEALLNAGQMLVYGCDSGGYRLLYATQYNSGIAIPELVRVGDMNTDVRNELVFLNQTCSISTCYKDAKILTWNAIVGVFQELNNGQITAINGRIGILDIDADGVLELTAQINPPGTSSAGPPRSVLDIWDWNGVEYVLALREQEEARYRIHAVYDADDLLTAGDLRGALTAYARLRDNGNLMAWSAANDTEILRAYAAFRIMVIYAHLGSARADDWFNTLQGENPAGSPGAGFAQIGITFMDNFRATGDTRAACAQAMGAAASNPGVLSALNSYGYANRTYGAADLCPF